MSNYAARGVSDLGLAEKFGINLHLEIQIMLKYILRILAPILIKKLGSRAFAQGPMGTAVQAKAAEILGVVAAAAGVASVLLSWIPILNILTLLPALLAIAGGGYALYIGRRHIFKRFPAIAGILAGIAAIVIIFYSNGWLVDKIFGGDELDRNEVRLERTIDSSVA